MDFLKKKNLTTAQLKTRTFPDRRQGVMQGHRKPNEFHVKWGSKTRTINVRLEEIAHVSWRCNSFAAAAVSTNRNIAGRPK